MEQNNYNVTQDMVNKLSDGQKFSNFLELSTYLNILNKNGNGEQAPSVSRQPRMCSYGRNRRGYAKGSKSTLRFSSNSSGRKSESWKSISTL